MNVTRVLGDVLPIAMNALGYTITHFEIDLSWFEKRRQDHKILPGVDICRKEVEEFRERILCLREVSLKAVSDDREITLEAADNTVDYLVGDPRLSLDEKLEVKRDKNQHVISGTRLAREALDKIEAGFSQPLKLLEDIIQKYKEIETALARSR